MDRAYKLTISQGVLEELGLNLYSSVPAVLSEIVANSYDANAKVVEIGLDIGAKRIVITDDGIGMTPDDLQERYLTVGYRRRDDAEAKKLAKRAVMGRKGIGKLAPFAIANLVRVESCRKGVKSGLEIDVESLKKAIRAKEDYQPRAIPDDAIELAKGTRITLESLTKGLALTEPFLKRRIARRFSVIGEDFQVLINGSQITREDRGYLEILQLLVQYDAPYDLETVRSYTNIKATADRPGMCSAGPVRGWIGSVKEPKQLKATDGDDLNRLVVIVRGKLAHENILSFVPESRVFVKYLVGELHADFLDIDEEEDIATSSRQAFIEDDSRFQALVEFVREELRYFRDKWDETRGELGAQEAQGIPAIRDWLASLSELERKEATKLISRINQVQVTTESRYQLYRYSVLAFEYLRVKDKLSQIADIDPDDLQSVAELFVTLDDVEAGMFHQITKQRLDVIARLVANLEEDVLENVLQDHLADNLWLLDSSWDKIAEEPTVERDMHSLVTKLKEKGDKKWKGGRIDIRYSKSMGKHIIIELKRHSANPSVGKILDQVRKYYTAAREQLDAAGRRHEDVEIVLLMGRFPGSARERSKNESLLRNENTRLLLYKEMADSAEKTYKEYTVATASSARIAKVLDGIQTLKPSESD